MDASTPRSSAKRKNALELARQKAREALEENQRKALNRLKKPKTSKSPRTPTTPTKRKTGARLSLGKKKEKSFFFFTSLIISCESHTHTNPSSVVGMAQITLSI